MLTSEAIELRDATRGVVDRLLIHEREFQATGKVPETVYQTLNGMGYSGMALPIQYGGLNLDFVTRTAVLAELCRLPPQFWLRIVAASTSARQLLHADESIMDGWLPAVARGERHVAFAQTEPDCGSDVYAMRTVAVRRGDKYVLNGTKSYCSNASFADAILIVAYTDKAESGQGISMFMVEAGTPGLSISPPYRTMGFSIEGLHEISLQDCEVPVACRIGDEGSGLEHSMTLISEARVSLGAWAVGMGDIAYEQALKYAQERHSFGRPIASHQTVQHMLADMRINQHAARLVMMEGARSVQEKQDVRLQSSIVKTFCSETCGRTADLALQVHGGAGYMSGTIVERVYRDIRVLRILDGANEIQRNTIAKQILT